MVIPADSYHQDFKPVFSTKRATVTALPPGNNPEISCVCTLHVIQFGTAFFQTFESCHCTNERNVSQRLLPQRDSYESETGLGD